MHFMHCDPATGLAYPTGQGAHDVEAYISELDDPAGHFLQLSNPVVFAKNAGMQVSPGTFANIRGGDGTATLLSAQSFVP